jgi:hypothetical protein
MADDLTQKGGPDRSRVNVDEDHEVNYWTDKWGVTEDELRSAVEKVGPMVDDIEEELGVER